MCYNYRNLMLIKFGEETQYRGGVALETRLYEGKDVLVVTCCDGGNKKY